MSALFINLGVMTDTDKAVLDTYLSYMEKQINQIEQNFEDLNDKTQFLIHLQQKRVKYENGKLNQFGMQTGDFNAHL